jgi:hypothetical protein
VQGNAGEDPVGLANEIPRDAGLRLILTNDVPRIEDHADDARHRLAQEQVLAVGLNPGWMRLEGLASYFAFHADACKRKSDILLKI